MPAICQSAGQSSGVGDMILWLDAQLPPSAAAWIAATFGIEAEEDLVEIGDGP